MPERKQHIIRIKGKDRDGSDLDEVWADVRRVDEITILDRGNGQEIIRQFAWDDGFSPDQPDVEREVTTIKLTDPENPPDDPDDPDIYIPLDVVNTLSVMDADQRIILEFANDPDEETTRDVTVKRVTFAETIPAEIPDPIDATEYERDQSTVDDSQYIDVEVINSYQYNDADQRVENELDQDDELLNQLEVSPGVNSSGQDVTPIRLDPLQQIVNVKWTPMVYIVVITANDSGSLAEGIDDKATVLESSLFFTEGSDTPIIGTLLEASANAGECIALTLGAPFVVGEEPPTVVFPFYRVIVLPHTDEAREGWFDKWVRGTFEQPFEENFLNPFLWWMGSVSMAAQTIRFSLKHGPHLEPPVPEGARNTIVQLWPSVQAGGTVPTGEDGVETWLGYFIQFYRTDARGTGTVYTGDLNTSPVDSWHSDEVEILTGAGGATYYGLAYGREPPLLAEDIPYIG